MRPSRPFAGWLAALAFLAPAELHAQARLPVHVVAPAVLAPATPRWDWDTPVSPPRTATDVTPQAMSLREPGVALLLSLALPGAGQHVLGLRRKWVYLAVEVLGWSYYTERRLAGGNWRARYRDFAWEEGRIQSGPRVDGSFSYYETLTQWTRSGSFDRDAGSAGVQPELDQTTYNGSIWRLAAQIFLPGGPGSPETDPGYPGALAYYTDRAYSAGFLWDWTGTSGAQQEFGRLIDESDDRFRQATNVLGAILANHVVSAVDAYLAARGLATSVDLGVEPLRGPTGIGWGAWGRLSLPR